MVNITANSSKPVRIIPNVMVRPRPVLLVDQRGDQGADDAAEPIAATRIPTWAVLAAPKYTKNTKNHRGLDEPHDEVGVRAAIVVTRSRGYADLVAQAVHRLGEERGAGVVSALR